MKNLAKPENTIINSSFSWYITGLVDGEGSFSIAISQNTSRSLGYIVSVSFEIALQASDKHILLKLKEYFGVGGLYKHGEDMYRYKVSSAKDIQNRVIPHFNKFPLQTQKGADFYLFQQVISIMTRGPLTPKDLQNIVNIKAVNNRGLSSTLKLAFPDTIPSSRPVIPFDRIPHPEWVRGFTEAEGCFFVTLMKNSYLRIGVQVTLGFILTQHSRDRDLLKGLVSFFGCGNYSERAMIGKAGDFKVSALKDITQKIIPFFKEYPLLGAKILSFKRLCLIAEIMEAKGHFSEEGLKKIKDIKSKSSL